MKRLTVQEVLEAYKETGLQPEQDDYFPHHGTACALGAVARHRDGCEDVDGFQADFLVSTIYGSIYVQHFSNGFDGLSCSAVTDEQLAAYQDGQAAWEAVKHLAEEE